MSAKRLDVGRLGRFGAVVFGLAMTLAVTADAADAQLAGGQWRLPPQGSSSGRTAVEKKPEPTVVVDPIRHSLFFPPQPIAFTLVPAIVMSNGAVLADFGAGFEPVLRPCSNASAVVVGQPQVVGANGAVLSQQRAPTFTQPVPAPLTPSQQMLSSSRVSGNTTAAVRSACFSRDQVGRVFVFRF